MKRIPLSSLECNAFTKHLLSQMPRASFYNLIDIDDLDGNYYFPSKNEILFPCAFLAIETHEIAHMVEMRNYGRLTLPDWGMKNWSNGTSKVSSKSFFAALSREIRVRAISIIIKDEVLTSHSTSYNIFNNFFWKGAAIERFPFGKFKNFSDAQEWANVLVEKTLSHYNKDLIESEWLKRVDYISNWMETAKAA
jgi:hypothetical protein